MITIATAVDVAALKDTTLLNMGIFGLFVAVTMVIVFRASRNNKTAADYYAAGRSFTGSQNGTAIAGEQFPPAQRGGTAQCRRTGGQESPASEPPILHRRSPS